MKLFDLLSDDEIKSVKSFTDVRNLDLNQLTVEELTELWTFIEKPNDIVSQGGGYIAAQALIILKNRVTQKQK